jgi:hypothetical protein
MIKNRIASTAAVATLGLAALGGIALAAPGNAEPGAHSDTEHSAPGHAGTKATEKPSTSGGEHNAPSAPHLGTMLGDGPQDEIFLEDWYDKVQPLDP